jgi:hypothetical protein
MNLREFNQTVQDFARQVPTAEIRDMQRKLALDGLKQLVARTPVKTGHARRNWQVTMHRMAEGEVAGTDVAGNRTVQAGAGVIGQVPAYSLTCITNNVPYICNLEDGTSQQAPEGMLALTFDDLVSPFA